MTTVANPYIIPLSWRNRLLVIGSGLSLWLLPWLAWPGAESLPKPRTLHKPPVFRYVRGTGEGGGTEWSPVLIPFPTVYGFSKNVAVSNVPSKTLMSILKPRLSESLYLDMGAPALPVLPVPGMSSLERREFEAEHDVQPVFGRVSEPLDGVKIEIQGDLLFRQFSAPALKLVELPAVGGAAVIVSATVELDRRGYVHHVLLDQPSGLPEVDSAVVRGIRAGTGVPGRGSASGTVKLYGWKSGRVEKE